MRNLLKFFTRFHFFFLFVIFEAISFTLIIQNNNYHKAKYFNFANAVSGFFYNQFSQMTDYLSLRRTNLDLAEENVRLFNSMKDFYKSDDANFYLEIDSIYKQQYYFTPAKVINNSINKQNNFLTVNKGRKHGITPEMAVISQNGIVGIIKNVSPNFSTVISVLNSNLRFSAKMKKNDYYGSVLWEGQDYNKAQLNEIPYHVEINIGDTIVTSGYSAIFPQGILIGFISDFELKSGNFYDITINLSTDFKNLRYVIIISNLLKEEQINLESATQND